MAKKVMQRLESVFFGELQNTAGSSELNELGHYALQTVLKLFSSDDEGMRRSILHFLRLFVPNTPLEALTEYTPQLYECLTMVWSKKILFRIPNTGRRVSTTKTFLYAKL